MQLFRSLSKPYSSSSSSAAAAAIASRIINVILLSIFAAIGYLLVSISQVQPPPPPESLSDSFSAQDHRVYEQTQIDHIVFGIVSSKNLWPNRREYVKLWWNPRKMRGCVFVDSPLPENDNDSRLLPPVYVSEDTSRFRYTWRGGDRSAIRIARTIVETVRLFNDSSDIRWFVLGDDDTIFVPENLAKTLSKYDHRLWYYIGSNSEIYEQNRLFGFNMAFGGGGLAVSYPLANVLGRVFDSCIQRYPHLYGGDSRIYACLAELGVGLSHEQGFHQFDVRGNAMGLLTSHPMAPLVSLHHMEHMDPIFPNTANLAAVRRLFRAASIDPGRILQLSVCYDRWFSWTISISWGYVVQIHSRHLFLPDVLPVQETFRQWKYDNNMLSGLYTFNTRPIHPDPCQRPVAFFLDDVSSDPDGTILSVYKQFHENCSYNAASSPQKIDEIRVYSKKLDLDIRQLKAPRRQCCDLLPSPAGKIMEIAIRECREDELIYMHP